MKRVRDEEDLASATNQSESDTQSDRSLRFVEFYSGIGGWSAALALALKSFSLSEGKVFRAHCCAALDHSDLCTSVYRHNHDVNKEALKQYRIEQLTTKELNNWGADIWLMSPPCQPHTRQHTNQANDLQDSRSESFLQLLDLLSSEDLEEQAVPSMILLENVVGFEKSNSFNKLCHALARRSYLMSNCILEPCQLGFPNDRPRYFCVAVRSSSDRKILIDEKSATIKYFRAPVMDDASQRAEIHTSIPELQVPPKESIPATSMRTISEYLDDERIHFSAGIPQLVVPCELFDRPAAWCFDIVAPDSRRSACFTSGYGRFIRGTGSILYQSATQSDAQGQVLVAHSLALQDPQDRKYQANWIKELNLDIHRLRYFSGTEMARLLGFPRNFSFPANVSLKQQWKLVGNSLNVCVAAKVLELGLSVIKLA